MTKPSPFPAAQLVPVDDIERDDAQRIADYFRKAIQPGVFWSLGSTHLTAVPGVDRQGGLLFTARILPMTKTGRGTAARKMQVMVSLTTADLIDIDVLEIASKKEHARIREISIDQLNAALLALDYNGDQVLNPRYW